MPKDMSDLAKKLSQRVEGEVMVDAFARGRYATDASFYQMMPLGVLVPKSGDDIAAAIDMAKEQGIPILPRGGGTSQCGQTVNEALVLDNTVHLNQIIDLDVEGRRCVVRPGIVLDDLNRTLKPHGLHFPVDVSTASRATIGGMAGNNSCGGKSLRYGIMRDNVLAIDAMLADGTRRRFGPIDAVQDPLTKELLALGAREAEEIDARFPKLLRRVGGYNIDALTPGAAPQNLAELLVGSEGTLAYSTCLDLKLSPLPRHVALGVCHFPSFHQAMEAAQHLVTLSPQAVELVDDTMIALSRDIPMFQATVAELVTGNPAALLLVEFAEDTDMGNAAKLQELVQMMGDLGYDWRDEGRNWGGVTPITDAGLRGRIAKMRAAGLNIMMSMKEAGKPVSFVEDCAVALPDLADYTAGLTEIFERHGTRGTWYAHASVGCLHVRPVLNLKLDKDVATMRAIAEECFDLVARYNGSHSGEHGDGILRSEFHATMFGDRMVKSFAEVKHLFDPTGVFNPGKITHAPKMDDRRLFRYGPDYRSANAPTVLDWASWPNGLQGAVEMCNNNGACRALKGGVMCPSFRATRAERDTTRGRANSLRLALSGQLGEDALSSDAMAETMKLCVSCKGCQRDCPTGVDMARMKVEVAAARVAQNGLSLHDRLVAYLPHYAPVAAKAPWLANLRNHWPWLAHATEGVTGFTATRSLPTWHAKPFKDREVPKADKPDAILLPDCFNRFFEPENLRAATRVLAAGGITLATPGTRLCCGRTFLTAGLIDQARRVARRLIATLLPFAKEGIPIIGLEPSCLLTLRDELPALLPESAARTLGRHAKLLEEFLVENAVDLPLKSPAGPVLLHGHCHQKAHGTMGAVEAVLSQLPNTQVETIETSCCGMAGAFGYGVETHEVSRQMAELDLLPAIRISDPESLIVASGTSCRHQIADLSDRAPMHLAQLLDRALERAP